MVNFPSSLDSLSNPTGTTTQNDAGFLHATQHANVNDIAEAIEAKVGIGATTPDTIGKELVATAAGTSTWRIRPCAKVTKAALQTISNNTITALTFDTERKDTDTIHDNSTNNTRLTCKTAGFYAIKGCIAWASNGTGERFVAIRLNGTTYLAIDRRAPVSTAEQTVSTDYDLAVNDYVELIAFQTSGGNLDVTKSGNFSPEFSMVWLTA